MCFSILLRNQQKGAYPLHIPISNDCTYDCLINRNQLLGYVVIGGVSIDSPVISGVSQGTVMGPLFKNNPYV